MESEIKWDIDRIIQNNNWQLTLNGYPIGPEIEGIMDAKTMSIWLRRAGTSIADVLSKELSGG